jgi:tRNA threonylcarbamoyladenosine biosynthesis protein TsaE
MRNAQFEVANLAETEALGRRLGASLFPGAVVALIGPLGAGKTHFVRAVAEGLGIANPLAVTSPTFVLIQEYPARLPIFHFDAYRLANARDFLDLGVHEYYEAGGVCLIEWADRVWDAMPAEYLRIEIQPLDEQRRRFLVVAEGQGYGELLGQLIVGK